MLLNKILYLGFLILINGYYISNNNYLKFDGNIITLQSKKINSDNKFDILYKPKTINQNKYQDALNIKEDNIIVVTGPAGTGKTLMACNCAINYLKQDKIEKIIITRPVVPVEEDIGFLPGNLNKKMDPWTRPIFDIFEEYYSKTNVNNMVLNGQIEISPLGFMRGRTFKNSFIIADEMQNSSPNQMQMLLTRIGSNSRLVITGDLDQSDKQINNGLNDLINRIKYTEINLKNILLIELNNSDIQRSELVNQIVQLYNEKNQKNTNIKFNNINSFYVNKNLNNDAALIPKHHEIKLRI